MIYNSDQIHNIVSKELPNANIFVIDSNYVTPNKKWLSGKFYRIFELNLSKNNLYKWREYHDCDNKSFKYWQFASDCHTITMMTRERKGLEIYQGIAVGVVFFQRDDGGGHAINCAIIEDFVQFIEPQTGEFIKLSNKEKESSWFAIF